MVSNCNKFHPIKDTTTCQGIADYHKISLANSFKWNPKVDADCSNLFLGANACAGVVGFTPDPVTTAKPTTTTPSNGITTPTLIQPGMVSDCNKFHPIKDTTTCQGIADYHKITLANFFKWNPKVNTACTNLLLDANACAGVIGFAPDPVTTAKPTTTKPANGVSSPPSVQPGIVSNCNKFHVIGDTTTCKELLTIRKPQWPTSSSGTRASTQSVTTSARVPLPVSASLEELPH